MATAEPSHDQPSRGARVMTWLAVGLPVILLVWGIAQYGWSTEVHQRFWSDIFARAQRTDDVPLLPATDDGLDRRAA